MGVHVNTGSENFAVKLLFIDSHLQDLVFKEDEGMLFENENMS